MSINQQDLTAEDHRLLLSTRKACCFAFVKVLQPVVKLPWNCTGFIAGIFCGLKMPQVAPIFIYFYAVQELNAIMSKSTDKSLELVELV